MAQKDKDPRTVNAFLKELAQRDPYDLTGARRSYAALVADGTPEADAERAAGLISRRFADNTIRHFTSQIRPYMEWCQQNHCVPVPATKATLTRFLVHITSRGRAVDGKPFSASSMDGFRHAIRQAHLAANAPDPFKQHKDLDSLLRGYRRLHAPPQTQAHTVHIDELAALINATRTHNTDLREAVIITVLADPEVMMTASQASRWEWAHVQLPEATSPDPAALSIPRGRGIDVLYVPNRTGESAARGVDFQHKGTLAALQVCGTTALRSLAASMISKRLPLHGPVLRRNDGKGISRPNIIKTLAKAAKTAGLEQKNKYSFDERILMIEALNRPDALAMRDAAIMALMWWGGLRRSQLSALNVEDIQLDSGGQGMTVRVQNAKTGAAGHRVKIPPSLCEGTTPTVVDAATLLKAWLDAYSRILDRPLTGEDPLFIGLKHRKHERLGEKGVGEIIQRYADAAGIEADLGERISSHGFRAGTPRRVVQR